MLKHFGGVNVLPPGSANVDGTRFSVARHQAYAISQAAVAGASRLFEVIKYVMWANEQAGINGIVGL